MKFELKEPPREFGVGQRSEITLKDCARIELAPDEQVTFLSDGGAEYDVTRKSWGYYATPSLNKRLRRFGFRSALAKGVGGTYFVHLVHSERLGEYQDYLRRADMSVVCWLDDERHLRSLEENGLNDDEGD